MSSLITVRKLREYKDARGNLVENTLSSIVSKSKHFFVSKSKPGVVRGNHYHHRKSEWFYLIQGTCKLICEDTSTKKREELILKESDHTIFNIAPKIAHALQNVGDTEMIVLAIINEVHDQKNPDTYPYKLI